KKNSNFFIGSFITALIGSIIMFANPAYLNAAQNTDGYKKIELSIGFIWNKIGSQMLPNMILNYKFLLIVFNLALLILFFKKVNNLSIINKIVTAFVMMYTIYGVFFYGQMNFTFRYDNSIINLFSIAYFICLLWIISSVFSKKELLFNIVLFLSVPLSAAPLIIAEPIGARSFYLTYCLWLLYTGTLYFRLFENIKFENRVYKLLKYLLRIAIGSILVFYFFIFAYMYRVQIQREKIISDSVKSGNTEIVLPLLPNENYTWKTSTGPDNWLNRFKKFYDIPEDKHVTFK
ncbi:MAG: DUF6056 family protein, partial [Enterococcus sp.]|nr:DUF6056 family protein [Enterococcus sp.]